MSDDNLTSDDHKSLRHLIWAIALVFLGFAGCTVVCDTAKGAEPEHHVARDANAPALLPDAPLSAVVVTQCNLIVAVYFTTKDGQLVRFDKSQGVDATKLLSAAYAAGVSERVEVDCVGLNGPRFEHHDGK